MYWGHKWEVLGIYWDNGKRTWKEHGNYYFGIGVQGFGLRV